MSELFTFRHKIKNSYLNFIFSMREVDSVNNRPIPQI